jgi:hypothetical protein
MGMRENETYMYDNPCPKHDAPGSMSDCTAVWLLLRS